MVGGKDSHLSRDLKGTGNPMLRGEDGAVQAGGAHAKDLWWEQSLYVQRGRESSPCGPSEVSGGVER